MHGPDSTGCDTVITRDGRFVYFANRGDDFLYSFKADPATGALTPMGRTSCGGKTPRNFTLDPTEHWMLVANQNSSVVERIHAQSGDRRAGETKARTMPLPRRCAFCLL